MTSSAPSSTAMRPSAIWMTYSFTPPLSWTIRESPERYSRPSIPTSYSSNRCRRDNCPLYEPPTESSLGVQRGLKSLTLIQHSLDIQNPMWKLVGLKLRISGVLQTLSYLSRKFTLILAVTTVVLPSLYVLWGTRSGTCRVFVYMLLREIPWEYRAVLYIVEKVLSKGSQRRRNREKRFSIHGEIKGTR